MSSANEVLAYELNTIKGHGLAVGDRFNFHGMASDSWPTPLGTRVELGKVGSKYMITTVDGEIHTWEFGASAKIWADTTIKHLITTGTRTLDNGDTVYTAECEHGWMTGFHTSAEDAYAVAEGHGKVVRPLYVPAKPVEDMTDVELLDAVVGVGASHNVADLVFNTPTPDDQAALDDMVDSAMRVIKDNRRVFVAEALNFGGLVGYDALVASGWATLVDDGDMSRYIRTIYTADRVAITDGLAVWDYNLNPGRVVLATVDRDGWFYVDTVNAGRSLMNGERVRTMNPYTGQTAREAVEGPSLGAIADNLVKADVRHAVALAAEVSSVVGKRAWGPNGLQGTIESTYSDGSINLVTFGKSNIIPAGRWKLMRDLPEVSEKITIEIHTGDGTVITEDDVKARVRQAFGTEVTESEVWAGTDTMIKRPFRALLGKRKRKASKVNARRVRGGF